MTYFRKCADSVHTAECHAARFIIFRLLHSHGHSLREEMHVGFLFLLFLEGTKLGYESWQRAAGETCLMHCECGLLPQK